HSYDAVLSDGNAWLKHLASDGVVVFDDYGRYPDVRSAVDELVQQGVLSKWGCLFKQMVGGPPGAEPSAGVRELITQSRAPMLRRTLWNAWRRSLERPLSS